MRRAWSLLLAAAILTPAGVLAQRGAASAVAAPTEKDWHKEDGPTFYDEPAIATDRQTVGWLVNYKNSSTSYDIPLSLMIHRSGKLILTTGDGFMVSEWHFWAAGKEVVYLAGTVHGDSADHSTRVDIATGKVLATYEGTLDEKSPAWARPPK